MVLALQIAVGGVLPTAIIAATELRLWRQFRARQRAAGGAPATWWDTWWDKCAAGWGRLAPCDGGAPLCGGWALAWVAGVLVGGAAWSLLWGAITVAAGGGGVAPPLPPAAAWRVYVS